MKTVLLSYLERNRVVKIPNGEKSSDLAFLEKEFRKLFLYEDNISISVSFHRFSADWEDYVELEGDESINDKDKLKVVVTPKLVSSGLVEDSTSSTPCGTVPVKLYPRRLTDEDSSEKRSGLFVPIQPSTSLTASWSMDNVSEPPSPCQSCDVSDVEPLPMPRTRKRPRMFEEELAIEDVPECEGGTDESEGIKHVLVKKKRVARKSEEDVVPLPDPFPLPKHYGTEVEAALKAKKFTDVSRQAFIGKVASAMLCFKCYPTREDYSNVGWTVIQTYPFLKSPVGSPAVS